LWHLPPAAAPSLFELWSARWQCCELLPVGAFGEGESIPQCLCRCMLRQELFFR
ncbi:unnamed protein product, partial [Musa hybrid cultivar]